LGLGLEGFFGREKPTEASDQSSDGLQVKGVGSTEGVEDLGPSIAGFRVSDIMGELDISGDGAVFVFARDGSDIHAYFNSMYLIICQEKNYKTHAYTIWDSSGYVFRKNNNLALFLG
jgi:hypothetical protein